MPAQSLPRADGAGHPEASSNADKQVLDSRLPDCVVIQKSAVFRAVMPDLIRHPEVYRLPKALDSPSTLLRVVSLSNHGSSPE